MSHGRFEAMCLLCSGKEKLILFCSEIVRAMTYVISQGWAMYWGTSRWSQVEVIFLFFSNKLKS